MSALDILIVLLIILIIWLFTPRPAEHLYTSGASLRITGTKSTDYLGDYFNKFGEKEGKYYTSLYGSSSEDKNPTYHTAVVF